MFFKSKQDREDFFQYLKLKRHTGRKASDKDLHTDWLRLTYGDSKGINHHIRQSIMNAYPLDENRGPAIEQLDPENATECFYSIKTIAECLSAENRCVFFLKYIWGFSNREIADCFGWHETNIQYKLRLIARTLKLLRARGHL